MGINAVSTETDRRLAIVRPSTTVNITIDDIRVDGGTQMRAMIDDVVVSEYAKEMSRGDAFPPVIVFNDGSGYWLADGFHRIAARRQLSKASASWLLAPCDVRVGSKHDAIRFACGANAIHGLKRTNEDKRMAVRAALEHPEMKLMTNRALSREIGVDDTFVGKIRDSLVRSNRSDTQPLVTAESAREIKPSIVASCSTAEPDIVAQKKRAIELSAKGMRISDIASALDRDATTVGRWINNPDAATSDKRGGPRLTIEDSTVQRMYDEGKSAQEIADDVGVTRETVGRALKRLGLSRAGKRARNLLGQHASRAEAEAGAWSAAADQIVATATVSSRDQVKELVSALELLSRAAANLKARLNKEVGKGE